MEGKITAVELDFFMTKYIPAPPGKKEPTKKLSTLKWSGPFKPEDDVKALPTLKAFNSWLKGADNDGNRNSRWDGKGYQVVVTSNKADSEANSKQRVDLALYPSHSAPAHRGLPKQWSTAEVVIQCKPESTQDDPFDEGKQDDNEPGADRRRKNLGQIISYASLIFDHQHRKHQYTVVLFGEMARIVRWDRGGVTVTKKFNYRQEPIKLSRFLWRLCHMSAEGRGHDPTVEEVHTDDPEYRELILPRADNPVIDKKSGQELGQHARLLFQESIKDATMCHKIRLHDGEEERSFLVGAPHFLSSELPGRGTRGYVAIDCSDPQGPFVYLKDVWRIDHDGIEPEGKVLKYLNDKGVEGVPTLVCHGDVEGQVTDSQEVWTIHHPNMQDCPVKRHRHYRLIVKEVCLSMSRFRNARELIYLIALCIRAHQQAYEHGVIHRDVSAGNVLIHIKEETVNDKLVQKRVGILTDWEMSKNMKAPGTRRQPNRTGTWQFMSAYILDNPDAAIQLPDELEAFFHVILFYVVRFLRHNCNDTFQFMHDYFDGYRKKAEGDYRCGTHKQTAMNYGSIETGDGTLIFYLPEVPSDPVGPTPATKGHAVAQSSLSTPSAVPRTKRHPLNALLEALLRCFKARYTLLANPVDTVEVISTPQPLVLSDDAVAFFAVFEDAGSESWMQETQPGLSPKERKQYEEQARALANHVKFLSMFATHVNKPSVPWPLEDKTADQLRED